MGNMFNELDIATNISWRSSNQFKNGLVHSALEVHPPASVWPSSYYQTPGNLLLTNEYFRFPNSTIGAADILLSTDNGLDLTPGLIRANGQPGHKAYEIMALMSESGMIISGKSVHR